MGVEIERKFLLANEGWRGQGIPTRMRQGYLVADAVRTVRVRIEGERAVITIKGKSTGATRGEWEYEIPVADATELLDGLTPSEKSADAATVRDRPAVWVRLPLVAVTVRG